jgi:hypothetical protein
MGVKKPTEQTVVEFNLPMTREQADLIYDHSREAVIFVLLELAARRSKQPGPHPAVYPAPLRRDPKPKKKHKKRS